jgi:hypothetical protein
MKFVEPSALTDSLNFLSNLLPDPGNGVGVEATQQASQIKRENGVPIEAQAVLHDLPDGSGLHKAVEQENMLFLWGAQIAVSVNSATTTVDLSNAAEVVSQQVIHARRLHSSVPPSV